MTTNLTNTAVAITVSDPWDFGTQCGSGPFHGHVVEQRPDALVVKLDKPLLYGNQHLEGVVVRARHLIDSITDLRGGQELAANFIFTLDGGASLSRTGEAGIAAIGSFRAT